MNKAVASAAAKAEDGVQQRLTNYACALSYEGLSPEAIHAAKGRIIDTFGVLMGAFFCEPCAITRNLAAQMPDAGGATIIGTRMKTQPDMAALVNGTAARYLEYSDVYHGPGSCHGHPSDVIMPVLAAGEHAQVSGQAFIAAVVLGYEVFCHISDEFRNPAGYDTTTFDVIAVAVAAGKLLGLNPKQLSHCISMAAVPNNILRQMRRGQLTMWKGVAAGYAGRAGVFAAQLARAGMEGPHLPFEGKAGWIKHVALEPVMLDKLGARGTFKILETRMRHRPCMGEMISSIVAAEKIAPLRNIKEVERVTVEVYQYAKDHVGTDPDRLNSLSRESADHSISYVVAATLVDGKLTPRSFNDAHLWNPDLRSLMARVEIIENAEFTKAWERQPREHRSRVTVVTHGGARYVGESGGGADDLAEHRSDAQIEEKFRSMTEESLGAKQVNRILERLWRLEDVTNVAEIPAAFVLD